MSTRSRSLLLKRESPNAAEAAAAPRHRRGPRVCLAWRTCRRLQLRGRCSQAAALQGEQAARERAPCCCRERLAGRLTAVAVLLHAASSMAAAGTGAKPSWGSQGRGWEPWRPWRAGTSLQASCTGWTAAAGRSWPTPAGAHAVQSAAPQQAGRSTPAAAPAGRHAPRDTLHDPHRCDGGRGSAAMAAASPAQARALHGRCRRLHAARPPLGPQLVDGRRMPPCKAGIAGPGGTVRSQLGRLPGALAWALLPLG